MSIGDGDFYEDAEISSSADEGSGLDAPPTPDGPSGNSDSEFDPPPFGEEDGGGDEGGFESSAADDRMREVKSQIEQRLAEAASAGAMSLAGARHIDSAGVQGVGISSGVIPGEKSLIVYVESAADQEQVRREIVDTMGVSAMSSDDMPMEIEVTGEIVPYTTNRSRFRPAPAGASVGHFRITAGTIGGWARGRRSDRRRRLLMVSNNHVLANSNDARFGDSIIQPGPADGGVNPADRIAILERFVPINFSPGAVNFVDAATGWCWPDRVRRDHVYHRGGTTARYFKIGNSVIEPSVNMVVGKTGRTTDLTQGTIRATGVSINVNYGTSGVGHFRDQFSVRSTTASDFSAGGDSGSIVWQWRRGLPPVGLLFAGGGGTTFCNRMSRVVTALDITLYELT
ncbi:hypothetical protein [Stieleria mannarensis]|uniref:hypothetical protein n=1 Tax=Stieleria mannarensis TaxID=2755585 RepID=UPI00160196D0|nr:hypothetical protein [Rhodopirellula sp. JC639]